MKVWRIVVMFSPLILIWSTACNPFGGAEEEIGQQFIEVTRGDLTVSVSGSGNIEVADEAKLVFGIGGKIDKLFVEEGDRANKDAVLARLDTSALELALTQAQVGKIQAELGVTQAQMALTKQQLGVTQAQLGVTQAQLGVTQAEVALEVAKYNLDRMEDVAEAKDDITDAEYEVKIAEMRLKEANYLGGSDAATRYWRNEVVLAQIKLAQAQQDLADLLAEDEYAGLVVDEVIIKQVQVKAAEATLEVAKLSVEQAQQSVEVAKLSVEAAKQSVEAAKLSVEAAKLSVEQAQKQLAEATLVAPFGGTIARVYVDEGDTVSTATTIFHLLDLARMELQLEVDEMDIPDVETGQKAIIEVDALPSFPVDGEVIYISPLTKEESGLVLYEVKIGFVVPEGSRFRAGMSATADIVLDRRSDVLLVPNRVLKQDSQGNPVVKVKEGEQIRERAVITGITDGLQTEIVGGLSEGEMVVIETKAKPQPTGTGWFQ